MYELFKAMAVTDDQVNGAVDAYFADPQRNVFDTTPGCSVNLSGAIEQHFLAREALGNRYGNAV